MMDGDLGVHWMCGSGIEDRRSVRAKPGRLCAESRPNAWDGVTRPGGAGRRLIREENSSALFAAKSYASGVDGIALDDPPDESAASAQIVVRWPALPASPGTCRKTADDCP